jgi:hypothetical protein
MNERRQPYIGISGIASPDQQHYLQAVFEDTGLVESNRRLFLGIKAVHKTQYLDIPNKYGEAWYPVGKEAFSAAVEKSHDLTKGANIAQAYLDIDWVDGPNYRKAFTERIFERGASWIDGIQFDLLPWHTNPDILAFLESIKQKYPDKMILLQCHGEAMNELGPQKTIAKLGQLAEFLDYVLFDSSHGTGKQLDAAKLDPFLHEAHSSELLSLTGLAIAGGLDASTIQYHLPDILSKYPNISWDAESRLHPKNTDGQMPLDSYAATKYLLASQRAIIDTRI